MLFVEITEERVQRKHKQIYKFGTRGTIDLEVKQAYRHFRQRHACSKKKKP